jgi:phage shock protein E
MAGLEEKINEGAKVVDVRTVDEFQDEHFPGAICIPVDQVMKRLAEFGEKDRPVVVYCASGS